MRTLSRVFIATVVAAAFAAPGYAQKAEKVPTKPVRILVGFSAGSATDITARLIAPKLSDMWGQPEMIVEVVTGRVQFTIASLGSAMSFIKDGRLVPLAVNTPKRSLQLPDVPSLIEIIPNFERDAAHALMAPGRTPTPIVQQISKDVARVLEMPDVKERMYAISFDPSPTTPEEYDRQVRSQLEIFSRVAKAVGLIPR